MAEDQNQNPNVTEDYELADMAAMAQAAFGDDEDDSGIVVFTDEEMAAIPKLYRQEHVDRLTSENERLRALLGEGVKMLRHVYGSKAGFAYAAKDWLAKVEPELAHSAQETGA